jgi:prevent-host-death family protein
MTTVTAGELRAKLGEILDRASAGERIIIERDHHAIAALVPLEDSQKLGGWTAEDQQRRLAALDRLREHAREMALEYPEPNDGFADDTAWLRWDRDHGHDHDHDHNAR